MDLYLNNSCKAAQAAASKAAASSLTAERERCDSDSQKDPTPEVGAANLLDLPLGVKLPVIPGSNNVFYTTNLSEKLYQPSYDFNLSDPYCRLLGTGYKSLHDPHLKSYYRRKDILRRLKKDGYVTSNNKVVCTLKELNKYRQYLTSLKLDFERNYVREQKMIEKQVNKLYKTKKACDSYGNTQFQDWLLQENKQTTPDQKLLIKQRYLDMISLELNKLEHTAENQNVLRIKEEERQHRDHIRRKLSLQRQIEEEWKTKEMLLLSKIGEEVKREARVEEQHKKVKEDAYHKKKALLEKKITYHLQKMQRSDLQREGSEASVFQNKSQDETEGERETIKDKAAYPKIKKMSVTVGHQTSHQGQKRPSQHLYSSLKTPERRSTSLHSPHDIQSNTTEQKKDRETIRTSYSSNDGETTTLQSPDVSAKTPGVYRYSLQDTSKQQVTRADLNEEKAKKSSLNYEPAPGVSFIHDSPIRQDYHPNRCQEKVTSEELNSIIQNIMTWVVAAVTSVLYPAITKYEERLQNITCPMPDNSTLSSDSESCCSTCCETSLYQTSKMVQAGPCTEAADRSIEQRVAPSKSSFARKERTDVETTYHRKEHLENKPKAPKPNAPKPKYNEVSESPNLKPCKSDSHLVVRIETGTRKCKDATTETDGLECPLSSDEKAKAISEMQELNNVFVNFHHHLKEEVELILGNIFQEMVSELTQTIPTLPSVTTEALPAQTDTDKEDLLSNVDISSAAAEIMENVFEKLQSAVKKTCTEEFSPENVSVHFKSDLVSGEHCISPKEKTSEVSLPYALENMNDVAEDMVRVILEKLTVLASSKQSELAHLKITTDPAYQQHREDPTYTFLQRASKRKSSAKTDAASLIGKEEIQNLVSNICSQSSLVGYIKEAISTILGYIQVGLNNERLVATKETVVILQLLDALLAQLHQKPVKTDVRKSRHSRMSSPSGTEERNRLTSTGVASAPRCRSPFPPINVPGMVLYSEDEKEEIDRIVENVLISSTKDEKAKLQEQVPDYWLTGANADFKRKRNMNLPTKPAYRHKVAFHDQGLNTDLPTFNKDPLKDKPGLNKDILLFSQDETYQIQKASEDIIRSILAEILKDLSSGPSDHSDYEDGREASLLTSRKPQDPSHQEWMDQMFSVSEIHTVSQDIVDDILKILHITSCHIIGHSSSVHQTSLNNADVPNKESLQIWFDSKRKMKFLSALSVDPTKLPWVESGTSGSTSESVDNLIDKIINTIFKKLNSFICPKLQTCFKPESHATHSKPAPDKKSLFQSHLSTFTTKVVKIVLDAIHKELRHNKKNLNVRKNSPPKNFRDTGFFADAENELDSVVTKLNNDIMTSSLATCICEVLSGNTDKSNILVPSDKLRSKISHGTDGIDQQKLLPSHCPCMQEEVHQCTRFQVLDRIGDALYDMLCKLTGDHPHSPLSDEQHTEGINKNLRTTSTLRSSIKLIAHTILEGIVSKLCGVDTDGIFKNSEFKAISEHIDTDSLSFALLLEEMSRCYDVISSIASSVTWPGNQEVTNKGKTTAPKIVTTKEKHLNKLKTLASDIFEMVFATLEGFANRNLENLGGNKKNKTYCESENTNICGNTHEKRLQSTLYRHAKKVSSTILKALQTEINMNLPDLDTCISKPLQEKQILKSLVNFILEAISPDMFNEPEPEERGIKNYRYRPIYGNFLPGGADPDSYLEDPADTEKESAGEERPTEDETKSDSLKQQELEKTLKTFEVELKEPKKSPLVPIVRSILNEIFQNDLIGQLKAFTLPQSHLCDTHADDEPFAQTSVESLDKTVGPLVSEADVTIVADDVIRTIFQKLYSAAMTDRNESENRYNTITFPADISFPKHTRGGKSPVCSTILDRNPCTLQSTFNIGKLTKINLVEDIIQSILTNLEAFATSKVKALFCPHISFTVPMALPSQQDEIALQQPWLSTKDSYSEDQFSCCSMDHSKSGKTTSICQLSASKLNMYATEVARQILQGIKHKLDQDLRSPFLTHSVVAFESIPSQVVSTVLDIVSTKGKYEKNVFDRETDPVAPEDIIEKLVNKSDYRKKLQFQILDTIEGILIDICEETIDENNLPLAVSTLNCNVSGRHLETNSERDPRYVNKAILKLLVPKECVAMISNDMVDIVLQNLTSAIMVCISSNDSISPILSTEFSDAFSKAEHQQSPSKDSVNGRAERQQPIVTNSVNERAKRKQPPVIDSVNERKRERFPFARKGRDVQLKSALSDDNQTTVLKKQDAKKSTPDPCKENAHFITKTILNRLKSFATERIDLLLILDPETREKPDVGSEFTNCKQNDSVFLESNQTPLDVTVPKISTAGTILSQEVTNYTLANYRENRRPAIHISQASLKEYADLIANTILTLIKNDIDLEIQKMYTYQNNTSFQENIIARETVNNILKSLCNKISLKASGFYLKQDPDLFTQLAVQNEIVPGQREMEDHTKLSLFSKYSGENQKTPEVENQRRTLEEIFRNGESGQEKTNSLLSVVKEILKKAYQRVWENTERCSPFNELPHFTSDSKIKTSAQKKALQSHISSVANDIVESVYRKIFSVIMTSLYENSETRGEMEASGSDGLLMNPSCFRELKQAEKSSDPPKPVIPQVYPYTGIGSVSSLENTSLQFSPLRLGEHLVQQVLKKITDFALLNLEESSSPKGQSDEILRPCSSKASPKGSPRASVKTNFKTKSKVTSLAKFRTKPQLKPIGAKAQSKTKLGPREKTLKGSWSTTSVGLPHLLSIGEAKTPSLRAKFPTAELKMYARDIVHNILQTIVNEFEEMRQNRAVVNVNTLLSDQIERASGIVNAVLQGLHAMKNNLANPIKGSHSDDIKLPQGYFSTTSAANPEAHFTLENVSSQLDKLFPKEDIFKQMFDKWQTESSNMENEKDKLLMIAKAVLNEISTKAGELEQSVSLLTLSLLEPCESRHHHFKRAASRVEDSQAQINIFGQEIVKKLFEKLELCFLTQMFTTDSKETLQSKKETAARRKCGSLGTNNLNNVPTYNTKLKDKTLGIAGHQITQEILEGVLNTLESFVDLQFKHVSTYAFSELVRTPIENFFAMQQKPPMKTIFPKLQTRTTFPDESKSSSMISQENIDNALQQLYFFHSELLTYAVNTVTDMLSKIKNKLDKEECHKEPSSTSIFEENIVANQIISTLMDQCTYFYELMIKNHPKENLLQGAKNACTVNCSRFTTGPEMSTSKSKGISCWDDPPQISSLLSYSEEDRKIKDKTSLDVPACVSYSIGDSTKTIEPMEGLESEFKPSSSRSEAHVFSYFDQAVKGDSSLPEDTVSQISSQKSSDPARAALEHPMSFRETEEGENQRVLHYEPLKPLVNPDEIQTTISPLKICLAAEDIVNTMLTSFGLSNQTSHTTENTETMKPFFISKESLHCLTSEQLKNEKSLLKIWEKRNSYGTEEENKGLVASGEDSVLLEKWKNKYLKLEKTLEEPGVIAFADRELGPHEVHLVARYVTTSVVTHFNNFETRGPVDEKVSISSTLLSKKYESKQPLRSINTDSSLNQFCEHLTELVISYIISSISDCTKDGETKQKSLGNEDTTCSEVILVHSQVFEHRSISIRGLALSISEVIIQILLNSDILKEDVTKVVSVKAKYIYCPKAAVADFSDLFQDLLIGVIHVLSKKIGINHHLDSKGKNKSLSTPKSHRLLVCNKAKTMKRQICAKGWKSAPTHHLKQLIQKSKLNSLACKLNTMVGSLRSPESKEVVNKIFNIVFNLFLPDECPNWDTDSGKTARKMFLSSNNSQSHRIPRNNLGLSPKSAFLLNVVCEKLIRMLLEECTASNFLTNSPFSDEISTEHQLFNTLQRIDDYSGLTMDYGLPFEEYDMPDLFENLAEIDQESMLNIISHSLVKSLMEKLSCGIQQPPRSPPVTDKHLTYRTSERPPSFPKGERPELKESKQGKNSVRFMSYDSKPLTGPSNNLRVIHSKMQTPFSKQFSGKFPFLPPLRRPDKKATAFLNIQYPGGMNTGVYSATFLEEIIVDIFLNLTTSVQGKNVNVTEAQLNEMNILDINCVVNEFNTAQVTVLRDVEEKMCFPPVYKETVSKIVDSVYNDVLWDYTLQVTCSDHLAYAAMSIAEQITSGILKNSIDYQLPLCFIRKLMPNSYYPLKAENILLKLQNNLSELNYQSQHSTGYITMLSYSFLADVIRRLLSQLIPSPSEASCLGGKYLKTSDFNELSTYIINKVLLTISKHKIWLTKYDYQCVYREQNLQNMVESIYNNILQMSDSLGSIQKSIESQSPIMVDRMASLIIQEITENHLQPFLSEEGLPHSTSPLDEISNMVKEVLGEVTGSHRPQKPSSLGISFYPNAFVEEIVARLLSKVFNPKYNMEYDLDKMTQKIVNSINNHFNKAKICILHDDQEQPLPTVDTDTMDELVDSVYKNVLKQHGLAVDSKELKDSDIFAENITNLIVAAISDYLFHPLFSGDLSASSYTILTAENIIQKVFRGITKPTQPSQHLSPYNTLLPYTFLEEIIRVLLSRIFPSASNMVPYSKTPKDRSEINHSEISSKLISDIRMKISQHEIRFSKDEDETESVYSEEDVQRLVDSTLRNIGQNSGSQEAIEHDITSSDNVFIDRIASFIIKNICQQHLHPFLYGKLPFTSSYRYFDSTRRRHSFFASVYPSAFLEDVISGVLRKIFHRALGIVQTKSLRDSEKELLETAEKFIYLITEEFSKVQVSTLENAEEQLCLPPVDRDIVIKIINTAYSKVLQEYELESNKDFFSDTKTLAERLTKIILAEVFDFKIPPYFIAKLPFKSYSKLNADVLIKRVHYAINTLRLRRQTCTTYTTILSHTHLEKIVTQVLSQINLLNCSAEDPYFLQSDFNNTVVRLSDEIMSIISKHAICIIKDGSEKNVISENSIQAMVDAIYIDISHLKLYQSLLKDKKGISNIPVTKTASYIIREIFNHHLESFLPGDKTLPCTMEQIYQQRAIDPKQREFSFIVNSAVFLEEVISELLCKILCIFSYVLATENPCKAKANVTDIVTRLVKSIVLEFTTSQILVADHLHENLYFSEGYKEMVKKTVNIIYEKILDDYQSLVHVYRAIQNDAVSFGEKIYHLLLEEIYDYQVESLVLGKLATSSYSFLQEENIIRNVLNTINNDSHDLPSCITVLPRSLLENMIYKLLARMFPSPETEIEPNEEEVPPDYEFVNAASKLTDDIITEISEHEIRLAKAEEHVENLQLGAIDDLADSICNNIIKKIKFEDEVQKDTYKRGGSFLGRIAGFIMKEIVDHHLQPFLCDEKSFPSDLPRNDDVTELLNPIKEKIQSFPQTSVYSATFLEDVVIDLVRKFYTLPRIAENPKDKEISERSIMGLAIKFANVLIGEFRKSEIKVLTNAEKMFSFPPVDKETVDKVCNSVYDEVTEIYGSKNIQKHDRSNIFIEMVAALTKKAISAFKILPLFSGSWSSTLFSFLDVDSIMQRIQHLPYKTFTKINRSLKENPVSSLERSSTLIPLTSELKNKMDTSEIDGRAVNGKENFKEKTSMKTGSIQQPICINISSIMKSKVTTIALEAVGGMAKKKKGDEKKKETSTAKDENISKLTSTTTSVKSKDTPGLDLGTAFTKNEIKKKDRMARKDEKGRGDELYQHLSPAMDDTKNKVVLEPGFEICGKKKSDKKKGSSLGKGDRPLELSSLKSKVRNTEIQEKRRDSPAYPATNDKQILHSKHAQNVPVSIYRNVLETSLQGPVDDLNYPSLLGDNAAYVTQACGKDFAQPASVNSAKENVPAKEEESEIQRQPRKWDNPQNLLENKPRIFPANFLENVISEIVNKLIFSSSLDTYDACQNVTNDVNPAELYGMAMKLIDSLLKEFSDAQIKVLNQDQGSKFLPSEDNISSVHKAPLRQNELSVVKRPSKKKVIMDTIPPIHNMAPTTKIPSSYQTPFMAKILSIDKMLVNKIVHSSICNILQDYRSQDSICEDINFNVEKLAKRLANAVIEEILQYQLNLLLYDEVPDSECLPLESKKVMKKVHKMAQTACKECQTSSPYTIMLPYEFLERIISSLLSKIFSTVANAKTEISEDNLYTELDSLQMKLASTVKTEISKDEDMIIQYVKSLHLNDEEIIQSVVQTIYNNLLPQFGSQESIRKCISSGCKILSEAIVNLVVQEVTGNQLQSYFSGELTPLQCTEIDNTIENILRGVIQTSEVPQPQPSRAYKLPFSIIEEIAVKFLSKLLSMFPKAEREQNNPLNTKMQEISSKILSSFQQYISKSHITVVPQVIESATVSLTDSATIEKVVTSVYSTVLKHCGSHISVYKDLMGKSNVLSDIIGFLMVKEISNSEFHPQEQDETSSSELVLESVKIMEKVAKIIDDLKSKSPTKKEAVLDARFLEETIALFLAKLVKLPSASSKDAENLSKPELNKIASQLTKSVTAEISRKNIIVVANPEEFFLNPESIEMISQMVDSVYNCVLQQSGTHEELYRDMKDTNHIFPKEVASLIIRKVSNCPLEMISSGDPCANLFGDLDTDRIVEKVHEYAIKIVPGLEQKGLDQGLRQEELSVRIIPHLGKQPINIDPDIVAEHLGVISIKTQSLDKLQTECLVRTGHSIETLRRASISGKNYSTEIPVAGNRKKEKRVSLDQMGRLNVKPLETSSRNSFQSLIKPDITKVELLKDVQSKKDLIIRLITHDISQENLERKEESLAFDEDEVVLQEVVKEEEEFPENSLEDQVKEDMKLATSTVAHPKPPISKCSLKKLLSVGKCQPKSSVTIITEGSWAKQMESEQTVMRTVSNTDVTTSECLTDTNSPWEKKTQLSETETRSSTEPTHHFIHRMMSASSYNEEDLPSFSSFDDERLSDPSAKVTEESLECPPLENLSSLKFITHYQRRSNLTSQYPSNDDTSDFEKHHTSSRQGSEMMRKISSAFLKVFSRSNTSVPKPSSPSPPHQDRK